MRPTSTLFSTVLLLALGCGDDGPAMPLDAPPPVQVAPTLSSIQDQIFTTRCSVLACHDNNTPASMLNLVTGASFGELVGVTPITTTARNAGKKLVDPGNPDNSFLLDKLNGNLGTGDGALMPLNKFPAWPEEIAPIRQWIMDGALAN